MTSTVRRILLSSDGFSPNSTPHSLPALLWPRALSSSSHISDPHSYLRSKGWDPQWVFPMFKQSHYHSTTHELLTIIRGNATLLLGGRDGIEGNSESHMMVDVSVGDLLLLPAGYAHRAVRDSDGFSMIGSYPVNGRKWDMCYPISEKECQGNSETIMHLVKDTARKGLGDAQDPTGGADLDREWAL